MSERPLMGNWVNKLREHRGVEKMDESKYAPRVLGYEVVRELYGEGQIFFYHKRNYSPVLITFDPITEFIPVSEKFFIPTVLITAYWLPRFPLKHQPNSLIICQTSIRAN